MLRAVTSHYGQKLETPYKNLPDDFKQILLRGSGETELEFHFWRAGKMSTVKAPFEGVIPNLERLYAESESEFTRNRLKAFMAPEFCDACNGQRLKPKSWPSRSAITRPQPASANPIKNSRPFDHGRLRILHRSRGPFLR
jgi:excinuclease UvrABC ATPase subunit